MSLDGTSAGQESARPASARLQASFAGSWVFLGGCEQTEGLPEHVFVYRLLVL
jgi:hypothetical protein